MGRLVLLAGCLFAVASSAASSDNPAADDGLAAWWRFDGHSANAVIESVAGVNDEINGNFSFAPGVSGKALKFDGYTTCVLREASVVPPMVDAFTIEAWIAPQTYSWNWTGIVDQAGNVIGEKPEAGELRLQVGLIGAKYNDPDFSSPGGTDLLEVVDHNWTGGLKDWSARWRGYIEVPFTGEISFTAEADNGLKLEIDKQVVIDGWGRDEARMGKVSTEKGKKYPVVLSYFQDGDPSFLRLYWSWEGQAKTLVDPAGLTHSESDEDYVRNTELGHKAPPPERSERLSFGIDSEGHIGMRLMIDGQLRQCVSEVVVPLLKWSHVAGTFDKGKGIDLYINGTHVGSSAVSGAVTPGAGHNLLIGMSSKKMSPTHTERGPSQRLLSYMVFDGLIDDVKIYSRALPAEQVERNYRDTKPKRKQPLAFRVMPSDEKDLPHRFGAAYCRLRYADEWEDLWRVGPDPDILVRFDDSPVRMLFWRGTGYGAVWVAENGQWMGDQSLERAGGGKSPWGCAEHMADKQCRYSHVRLLENSDARVVVHWRYAISDIVYGIFGADKDGWGEWADEYYYIYPDGASTRKQILHSNHLSHEWQETIVLNQPGTRPEDNIEMDALTWGNMDGESKTYTWADVERDDARLRDTTIQVVNLKSDYRPFIIWQPDSRPKLMRCCVEEQWSRFPWWNHWPVAQLPNDGRRTGVPDRPAHSSLGQSIEDSRAIVHNEDNNSFTAVHLCGMSNRSAKELAPLAKSWNRPAQLVMTAGNFHSEGYDRYQRAYVLFCEEAGRPSTCEFELAASEDSPIVNPAFVVKGWGQAGAALKINGKTIKPGKSFRSGYSRTLESSDLVVWIDKESDKPITISLSPEAGVSSWAAADAEKETQAQKKSDDLSEQTRLRLPSGPKGVGRFGAYYETLKYEPGWDSLWKIADDADVVVRFDEFDHRFVFWRGTSYIPCWATYDGAWYTNEFFERNAHLGDCSSMCEPMSDKQCRYSHVRVIESTDARVVVHWRYSPADLDYLQPYRDKMTGWGDWVDEYYTIYPDSVGVRKATIHTGSPLSHWIEYQEGIVVNQPGTIPEDNINFDAITFANLKGESKTYSWENGDPDLKNPPEKPCIQVINFKNRYKPFTVVDPDGVRTKVYGGHAKNSHFNWWNHWPVAQEKSDTTVAESAVKPSHSSLTHIEWKQYTQEGLSRTWIMLHGMTNKPAAELAPLANSWLSAPWMRLKSGACRAKGYDQTQRAYVLACEKVGRPSKVELTLDAREGSPVINPAFVIEDWGGAGVSLKVNGKKIDRGPNFRFGHHRTQQSSNLIVWFRAESTKPVVVSLSPVGD
ncbi:MAG TPA: LamG-like jellyroll fold domain-containing protein [Sedimentisphaerales bacterium]|nr:LamG-like jellyroll fold domain-containing protein [Sedimentisphaerales bacterium]